MASSQRSRRSISIFPFSLLFFFLSRYQSTIYVSTFLIISCRVLGVSIAQWLFPVKEWIHHMCPSLWPRVARHDASTPTHLESSRNAAELITPAFNREVVQGMIAEACAPLYDRLAAHDELSLGNRVQIIATSSSSRRDGETQLSNRAEAADNEG